jgi:hypothetical protein
MLSCRTKLEKFECLKKRGRSSLPNASWFGTGVDQSKGGPAACRSAGTLGAGTLGRTKEGVAAVRPVDERVGLGRVDHAVRVRGRRSKSAPVLDIKFRQARDLIAVPTKEEAGYSFVLHDDELRRAGGRLTYTASARTPGSCLACRRRRPCLAVPTGRLEREPCRHQAERAPVTMTPPWMGRRRHCCCCCYLRQRPSRPTGEQACEREVVAPGRPRSAQGKGIRRSGSDAGRVCRGARLMLLRGACFSRGGCTSWAGCSRLTTRAASAGAGCLADEGGSRTEAIRLELLESGEPR